MIPQVIQDLDLEPLLVKAIDADEGLGWSLDYALQISEEYRKYLTLCLENPNVAIVPARDIDEFWHLHILDTQKYQADCEQIFGYFLHHFPYFGMRGVDDAKNLRNAWALSCEMYQQRFGKINNKLWVGSARCPNCGRRCKNDIAYNEQRPRLGEMH